MMLFATGLREPESPICLPDKSILLVETGPGTGQVIRIGPDGNGKQIIAKTGRPNGLALDRDGFIWVAESSKPALLRLSMDGLYEEWLSGCNGAPFLFPNDLCFGPDGWLYMTDSGILYEEFTQGGKGRDDYSTLKTDGRVYRISSTTKEICQLEAGLSFPNGIAFGPDDHIYINETLTGMVYSYAIGSGIIGPRQPFSNVIDPLGKGKFRGPDGMKFDREGRLYVAMYGQQDITVLGKDGSILQRIKTSGCQPSNLAFGPPGSGSLFVTECELGVIESFELGTEGFPLYA